MISLEKSSWILPSWWNFFFHARTTSAHSFGGICRIVFAVLYLVDRGLWTLDLDWMLSPSNGVLNFRTGRECSDVHEDMWAVFMLAPDSDRLFWTVHWVGIIAGFFLLLGVWSKLMLVLVHVSMMSFHHISPLSTDAQDVMFRIWAFQMLFLPLNKYCLFDQMRTKTSSKDRRSIKVSFPMWPIRLWQIQVCFIYMDASAGKLLFGSDWLDGDALYKIQHLSDFYGGLYNPSWLLSVAGPCRILCWGSLLLECLSWVAIWPLKTRYITFLLLVGFHVGIDLAMNMHCFEWLSIMGWCSFLVLPSKDTNLLAGEDSKSVNKPIRYAVNLFIAATILIAWCQCDFVGIVYDASPLWLQRYILQPHDQFMNWIYHDFPNLETPLYRLGLWQESWTMFGGSIDVCHKRYKVTIHFEDDSIIEFLTPDWSGEEFNQRWWQRKRYQRPMDYFDHLMDADEPALHSYSNSFLYHDRTLQHSFCNEHTDTQEEDGKPQPLAITLVQLHYLWIDGVSSIPPGSGFWDKLASPPPSTEQGADLLYEIEYPEWDDADHLFRMQQCHWTQS